MHEAGIAVAVAAEITGRGLDPARVRLVISGGHGDETSFDAALRLHLAAAAPRAGLESIAIVHAPVPRICASCTTPFQAPLAVDPCPACGGPGIALPTPESVELEWLDDGTEASAEVREAPHGDHDHDHKPAPAHDHGRGHRQAPPDGPDRPPTGDSRHSMAVGPGGTLRP